MRGMLHQLLKFRMREGVTLVEDQEAEGKAGVTVLRDAARIGIADGQAGRYRAVDSPQCTAPNGRAR
jgi:hypothetical protein